MRTALSEVESGTEQESRRESGADRRRRDEALRICLEERSEGRSQRRISMRIRPKSRGRMRYV